MSTEAKQRRCWCSRIPAPALFFFKVVATFGLLSSDAGGEAAICLKASLEERSSARSGTLFINSSIPCAYLRDSYPSILNSKTSRPETDESQARGIADISGRCLHPAPFRLRAFDNSSTVLSFSTAFTFALARNNSPGSTTGRETIAGLAFVLVPAFSPPPDHSQYLALLNATTRSQISSRTFGAEFDSFPNSEFEDFPDDHVGVDFNSRIPVAASRAGYNDTGGYHGGGHVKTIVVKERSTIHAWISYNASTQKLSVTVSTVPGCKPQIPLLETKMDLSEVIVEEMYVGFSTSAGANRGYSSVSSWSFDVNGSEDLIISGCSESLPSPCIAAAKCCHSRRMLSDDSAGLPLVLGISIPISVLALFSVIFLAGYCLRRMRKTLDHQFHDLIEMENVDYVPKSYSYQELSIATEDFSSNLVLGSGGFGSVYRGILPAAASAGGQHGMMSTGFMLTVAVKRMGTEAWRGTEAKDVIAELEIIGRLRHQNLLQLLGWCSETDKLLLVYEYMANGSLDQWLFSNGSSGKGNHGQSLSWDQRLHILGGVATALGYLHEEWQEVVVHRAVKSSNVLLDMEFNAKLGDFGLAARSHERHSKQFQLQSIRMVDTLGYLAPEARSRGRFSDKSDVYSFGILILEVASGRRSVDIKRPTEEIVLVAWVWDLFEQGRILDAVDDSLSAAVDTKSIDEDFRVEMTAVIQIGLICSHPDPNMRPAMGQVIQMLKGEAPLLPIGSASSRPNSRNPSLSFSFSDHYVWADHSVDLGMIDNSDEIKLIPQSQASRERTGFSFAL